MSPKQNAALIPSNKAQKQDPNESDYFHIRSQNKFKKLTAIQKYPVPNKSNFMVFSTPSKITK